MKKTTFCLLSLILAFSTFFTRSAVSQPSGGAAAEDMTRAPTPPAKLTRDIWQELTACGHATVNRKVLTLTTPSHTSSGTFPADGLPFRELKKEGPSFICSYLFPPAGAVSCTITREEE